MVTVPYLKPTYLPTYFTVVTILTEVTVMTLVTLVTVETVVTKRHFSHTNKKKLKQIAKKHLTTNKFHQLTLLKKIVHNSCLSSSNNFFTPKKTCFMTFNVKNFKTKILRKLKKIKLNKIQISKTQVVTNFRNSKYDQIKRLNL